MPDYSPFIFLVDLLAVFRLTRLVTKDSLLNGPRFWILQRWPSELTQYPNAIVTQRELVNGTWLGRLDTGVQVYMSAKEDADGDPLWEAERTFKWSELLECPHCAGVWLAAGVVALRFTWGWWQYVALGLALAAASTLIFLTVDND